MSIERAQDSSILGRTWERPYLICWHYLVVTKPDNMSGIGGSPVGGSHAVISAFIGVAKLTTPYMNGKVRPGVLRTHRD